eukprot:4366772-Pyramimonas_sp.AAC.1
MPHRELQRRPKWPRPHAPSPPTACPFRHTPHTIRGPIGISTEGSSGRVRMSPPHSIRHTPHTVRSPIGSSTDGSSGKGSHDTTAPNSAHPSHVRGPMGSSAEGSSGR